MPKGEGRPVVQPLSPEILRNKKINVEKKSNTCLCQNNHLVKYALVKIKTNPTRKKCLVTPLMSINRH